MATSMVIRIVSGVSPPTVVELEPTRSYTIGRKDADIELGFEKSCSRHHATLTWENEAWAITDAGSSNGTKVDGVYTTSALLRDGSRILIGATTLECEIPNARSASARRAGASVGTRSARAKAVPVHSGRRASVPTGLAISALVFVLCVGAGVYSMLHPGWLVSPLPQSPLVSVPPLMPVLRPVNGDLVLRLDKITAIPDASTRLRELEDFLENKASELRSTAIEARAWRLLNQSRTQISLQLQTAVREALQQAQLLMAQRRYHEAADAMDKGRNAYAPIETRHRDLAAAVGGKAAFQTLSSMLETENRMWLTHGVATAQAAFARGERDAALATMSTLIAHAVLGPSELERLRDMQTMWRDAPSPAVHPGAQADAPTSLREAFQDPSATKLARGSVLLPKGRASEDELIEALRRNLAKGFSEGKLEVTRWIFPDDTAEFDVRGMDDQGFRCVGRANKAVRLVSWDKCPLDSYALLASRMDFHDRDTLLALALLGWRTDRPHQATTFLVMLLEQAPALKADIDALVAAKRGIPVPEGGFVVFGGELIARGEEQERLEQRAFEEALEAFRKAVTGTNTHLSAAAEAAFQSLLTAGERAVLPTLDILEAARATALQQAEQAVGKESDVRLLRQLRTELNRRRKAALDLIYDEARWPYPAGPNDAQVSEEVLKAVEAVRQAWDNPFSVAGARSTKVDDIVTYLKLLNERMDQIDPTRKHHNGTSDSDLAWVASIANRKLDVRSFGLDTAEKAMIALNEQILAENEATKRSSRGDTGAPNAEAWELLALTNAYRVMMGRRALRMNAKLFWAAEHHAQWCHGQGKIAHDFPGSPKGTTPAERIKAEGYSGGFGENLHLDGRASTPAAIQAWIGSSGHHRNMLMPMWSVAGTARHATVSVQVFGSVDEGTENANSKGGQ